MRAELSKIKAVRRKGTTAQDFAALKRAIKDLRVRVDALEGSQPRLEQVDPRGAEQQRRYLQGRAAPAQGYPNVGDQRQRAADQRYA
jgi:hypothetical protein